MLLHFPLFEFASIGLTLIRFIEMKVTGVHKSCVTVICANKVDCIFYNFVFFYKNQQMELTFQYALLSSSLSLSIYIYTSRQGCKIK